MQKFLVTTQYKNKDGEECTNIQTVSAGDFDYDGAIEKAQTVVKAFPNFESIHAGDCIIHHPVDSNVPRNAKDLIDERMFSSTDMGDFAYEMFLAGVALGKWGGSTIEGLEPLKYIDRKLDHLEGG